LYPTNPIILFPPNLFIFFSLFSLTNIQTSSSTFLSSDFSLSSSLCLLSSSLHLILSNFSFSLLLHHSPSSLFISIAWIFSSQLFTLRFMTIVTDKKKVTSHFHLFSFFYHLSDLLFFLSFFVFGGYFSLRATYFCYIFCLMNVLLSDLLLLYDEIGWIEVFFSNLVFDVYFVFICSFLLVDLLL